MQKSLTYRVSASSLLGYELAHVERKHTALVQDSEHIRWYESEINADGLVNLSIDDIHLSVCGVDGNRHRGASRGQPASRIRGSGRHSYAIRYR
jgi:hypothetical protein